MPKQIVFPGKNQFKLSDYQEGELAANEIRGKTIATLISQGTELGWSTGDDFPIYPGYAAVFQVEEMGAGVEGVNVGDLRFCMGHHRETQCHDARFTLPLPDGLSAEHALLARLMGVSMTTLMTTKARPGDKVIVTGAGPVGILAAHNFQIGGYDVAIVEPDATRRAQAEQSGISKTFSTMPLENPEWLGNVALVCECSGHEAAALDGCKIVRKMGEVVLVGVPWKAYTDILSHEILNTVFFNFVELRSGWEWEIPVLSRDFVWEELLEGYNNAPHTTFTGFERALSWIASGKIELEGLITNESPANPEELYARIFKREIEEPFIVLNW